MRNLLFIINPKAGKRLKFDITIAITNFFEHKIKFKISVWKNVNEFDFIHEELKSGLYTDAIAVGGDGTVNQVAKSIVGTSIRLGVVPLGSGNGLGRSLGLSMKLEQVFEQILKGKTEKIDVGNVNNIPFFCTSGVGFDAHIGNLFATSTKRGLATYVKITIRELIGYKSKEYSVSFDGKTITRKAYLITVANAGQYGNNFYIAPQASLQDGKFRLVIVKPTGFFGVFELLFKILGNKAYKSKYAETFHTDKITITRKASGPIHFDGEPENTGEILTYGITPLSLNVIVGEKFKPSLI